VQEGRGVVAVSLYAATVIRVERERERLMREREGDKGGERDGEGDRVGHRDERERKGRGFRERGREREREMAELLKQLGDA
jgi:hypothetical protein